MRKRAEWRKGNKGNCLSSLKKNDRFLIVLFFPFTLTELIIQRSDPSSGIASELVVLGFQIVLIELNDGFLASTRLLGLRFALQDLIFSFGFEKKSGVAQRELRELLEFVKISNRFSIVLLFPFIRTKLVVKLSDLRPGIGLVLAVFSL